MPEPVRIVLKVKNIYKCIKHKTEYIQFKVRALESGLDIGLFVEGDHPEENNPTYTIKVGHEHGNRNFVALDKKGLPPDLLVVKTPFILGINEWRGFWIYTANATISFGTENECEPIISWPDTDFKPIEQIGFKVGGRPYIDLGDQLFEDPESDDDGRVGENEAYIVIDTTKSSQNSTIISKPSGTRWVRYNGGAIPENAVIGGHDNEHALYVVRALIREALTPGKLMHGRPYCEVSWGGRAHAVDQLEVLAGFDGDWVKTSEDKIPQLALLAGRSEDGFPLYIGRAEYRNTLTIGKVQPNHKTLYIPFGGRERAVKNYEILCHKPPGPPVMPHPPIIEYEREYEEKQPPLRWVYSCNRRVPRNAFVAGDYKGSDVMLIRGKHEEAWCIGWMHCEEDVGYIIGEDGCEVVEEFEVLCDFNGYWEKPLNFTLPANALVMGSHPLFGKMYVGRASHSDKVLCGLVEVPTMRCRIPYQTEELIKDSFEVLCYPDPVGSLTKKGLQYVKKWDI